MSDSVEPPEDDEAGKAADEGEEREKAGRHALDGDLRGRALWILGGSFGGSIGLLLIAAWGASALAGPEAVTLERDILLWLQTWSGSTVDLIVRETSSLSEGMVLAFLVGLMAVLLWRRHRREAWLLLFVYPASAAVHWSGKLLVGRRRPQVVEWSESLASGSSYPSGHAVEAAAIYLLLAYVITRTKPWLDRRLVWVVAVVLVLLAGVNRVYLGVHWPTDVLAGWLAGAVLAAGAVAAHRLATVSG